MPITLPHAVFLYDENGNPVPATPDAALNPAQKVLVIGGSDGAQVRTANINSSGALSITGTMTLDGTSSITGTILANIGSSGGLATQETLTKLALTASSTIVSASGPLVQGSVSSCLPTYVTGQIHPLSLDTSGYLRTRAQFQAPATDAFGRFRVSNPKTLFQAKPLYGDRTSEFVEKMSGSGTSSYDANAPIKTLLVGAGVTGSAIRQTKWYSDYQAGKSQQILATFAMSGSAVSGTQRVGYYDTNNGLFLEKNNNSLSLVRRSNTTGTPIDYPVTQENWNIDKLDGTGPCGRILSISSSQILFMDFEWLGVGSARAGFVINGEIIYAHQFNWANENTGVYMATPSLPVRWEVNKTSASATPISINAICCSISSEGGSDAVGWQTAIDRGVSLLAYTVPDGTAMKPIISVRTKTEYTRMTATPELIQAICTTNSANGFRWALLLNPTITGGAAASWVSAGSNSGIEYDISQTGVVTLGTQVASGYAIGTSIASLITKILPLGADVDGVRDVYVLAVQQLAGAAESFIGSLIMREIF